MIHLEVQPAQKVHQDFLFVLDDNLVVVVHWSEASEGLQIG